MRPIRMNRKRWAPVAAVAAVLAVLVGVSFLSNDRGAAGPPLLRLAAAEGSYAAAADGRGSFRLIGTLPDGPLEARVRDLPAMAAPDPRVRALAIALAETASPTRVDSSWKAGDLVVTDEPGNPWTWGLACGPGMTVSSGGSLATDLATSICAYGTASSGGGAVSSGSTVSSGGTAPSTTVYPCPSPPSGAEPLSCDGPGIPLPVPPPPEKVLLTDSQALAATANIRYALGLGSAPTRVEGLSVVVEPLAGGLHTTGMATLLQLSSRGTLVGASGSLSTGREGALYPLRSARRAFDDIPVVALGAPCSIAGCPEGPAITGARLGLSRVALADGAAALVPAWLFTMKGSPVPLVSLAVADRFLGGPGSAKTQPGTEPGTEPRTTEPDPASSPRPTTGKSAIPSDRERFRFDAAYADADATVLVVRYGDSGSCPSQAVHPDIAQEPDRVVVTLTRTPMRTDLACTSDYRAMVVRLTLTAPLGSREVVDGSRREPVPISTGAPPLG